MSTEEQVTEVANAQEEKTGPAQEVNPLSLDDAISIEGQDILAIKLLEEKQRRIQAEKQIVENEQRMLVLEKNTIVRQLSEKYRVDINSYVIDMATGVAIRRLS